MKKIVLGFIVGLAAVGFSTRLPWVKLDTGRLELAEIGGHQYVVAVIAYASSGGISVTHHAGCPACTSRQDQKSDAR